ncbi:PREDICTED: amphoterin-induced protein 1 [Nanorana parkeri]|uniref:amphoterin-induced protein 1 n=1 Tax=Nanorana parkeri TaxID=125878 RepID=UPI0008549E07|nr:PREDICTED: amphoterin-induced protein 1 [Nanorana parkeri]
MRLPCFFWPQLFWAFNLCFLETIIKKTGASPLNCQETCVCASDVISCSKKDLAVVPSGLPKYIAMLDLSHNNLARLRADWTAYPLKTLNTLSLSHNHITFVSSEAFLLTPNLRHLDLSCNKLRIFEENAFSALENLEVLLLFKNKIVDIDRTAFDEMKHLQKLYLSHNLLQRFPLELVKDGEKLPELTFLDLSSNHIKALPVKQLRALPAWLSNRLYLHGNQLTCNCELYGLFWHWHVRQLASTIDFREEIQCYPPSQPRTVTVNVFSLSGSEGMNCSVVRETGMEAHLEETVTLNCDTKQRGVNLIWVTPGNEWIQKHGDGKEGNHSIYVLSDGRLQIKKIRLEDKGTYTCYAQGEVLNETLYVTLTVFNFTQHVHQDTLNTAYTTLVGCVASVILVLIYLYLTPCRCWCRPGDRGQGEDRDSIRSSVLSATPNHETTSDKAALSRHVAFLDPPGDLQGQNGKLKPNGSQEAPGIKGHKLHPSSPHRKLSDPGSISSVFSDTPIVV